MADAWKHPAKRLDANEPGWWVDLWSGYEWIYFMGPFSSKRDAEWATTQWKQQYFCVGDACFRTVNYETGAESPAVKERGEHHD